MKNQEPEPSKSYDVGYKKPPQQHQFKKGQSGNPKGRPKKPLKPDVPDDFYELISSALLETVVVKKNGKTIEITKHEMLVQQLINDAISGSASARIQVIKLLNAMDIPEKAAERWDKKLEALANQDPWTPEMEKAFQEIYERFRDVDDEDDDEAESANENSDANGHLGAR